MSLFNKDFEIRKETTIDERLNNIGLNVKDFGAKGNGKADDTNAFRKCFEVAKVTKQKVIVPQGNYIVTDTILDWAPTGSGPNGFAIEGIGISAEAVKIKFTPPTMSTPLIRLANIKTMLIRDITIESVAQNNRQGIGLVLGDRDNSLAVTNFKSYNLNVRYFDVGIDARYGWLNQLYSTQIRYCNTGCILAMNAIDNYGLVSEGNGTGVWVNGGGTVNFFGGCVETNDLGFRISKGLDVNLIGVYIENNNAIGHIMAGTDDDTVQSLTFTGGSIHYSNPIVFDKINVLKINGLSGYDGNASMTITENVKSFKGDFLHYNNGAVNMHSGIISNRKNAESEHPFFSTDFRNLSSLNTSSETFLDASEKISITPVNGSLSIDNSDYLTGNKTIKFTSNVQATSVSTYALLKFYFDEKKLGSKMFMVMKSKITNSPSFIRQYYAVYNNNGGTTTSVQVYSINPTDAVSLMSGKYVTEFDPIDISAILSRSDFVSLARLEMRIYNISSTTGAIATGNEMINIDSIDLYNSALPMSPYQNKSDQVYRAEFTAESLNTSTLMLGGKKIAYGTSIPASGTHKQGDLVINSSSISGGNLGWICTVAGNPGTWERVGVVGDAISSTMNLRSTHGIVYQGTINDAGAVSWTTKTVGYDFLDRADSTTGIGTSSSGKIWTPQLGTYGILNHEIYSVTDTNHDIATFENSLTDYVITCDMKGQIEATNQRRPGIIVRGIDKNNHFIIRPQPGSVVIKTIDGGSESLSLMNGNYTFVNDQYYTFKVACKADKITAYVNGQELFTYTMTTAEYTKYANNTLIGIVLLKAGTPTIDARWREWYVDQF